MSRLSARRCPRGHSHSQLRRRMIHCDQHPKHNQETRKDTKIYLHKQWVIDSIHQRYHEAIMYILTDPSNIHIYWMNHSSQCRRGQAVHCYKVTLNDLIGHIYAVWELRHCYMVYEPNIEGSNAARWSGPVRAWKPPDKIPPYIIFEWPSIIADGQIQTPP